METVLLFRVHLLRSIATKLPLAGGTLTGNLNLGDNVRARFGTDNDLQIYHDGSHARLRELTGEFRIQTTSGGVNAFVAKQNAEVELFHAGSVMLATTSTGIDVTGNIGVSGTVDGIDIAARDAVLTSTTTTAGAHLPKAGGTMTGGLSIRGFNGPVLKLGSSGTSDPRIDFEDQNSTNLGAGIFLDQDADTLRILRTVSGSATDGIAINASGNVGIGTAAPADRLHVALDSSTTNAEVEVMRVEATSSGTPAVGFGPFIDFRGDRINGGPDSYGRLGFEADAMPSTTVDGAFVVQTAEDGNYSERLRITSDGNLLLGLNSATGYAADQDNFIIKGSAEVGMHIIGGTSSTTAINFGDGTGTAAYRGQITYHNADDSMRLNTAATERMRIDSSGSVGIGTINPLRSLDVRHALNIFGSGGTTELMLRGTSGTAQNLGAWHISVRGDVGGANDDLKFLRFTGGNSPSYAGIALQIQNSTGNVGIGTDDPDARLGIKSSGASTYPLLIKSSDNQQLFRFREESDTRGTFYINDASESSKVTLASSGNSSFMGGNVGIGTDSPSYLLHAQNSTSTGQSVMATSGNGQFIMAIGSQNSPGVAQEAFVGTLSDTRFKIKVNNVVKGSWTDGGLAIGTHSMASYLLHIKQPSSGDSTLMLETVSGGDPSIIFNSAAANRSGLLKFQDNGTNVGRIEYVHNGDRIDFQAGSATSATMSVKNGKVGIGVTSPNQPLEVNGNIGFSKGTNAERYLLVEDADATWAGDVNIQAGFGSTGAGGGVKLYGHAHGTYPGSVWIGRSASSSGNIMFGNGGTGPTSTAQIQMVINSSGNVGIGESDPDSTLTVKGASHTNFQVKSNSESTKAFIQTVQDSDVRIGSSTNHPVAFYQNGVERMRTDSDGVTIKSGKELRVNRTDNARDIRLFCDNSYGTIETTHDPIRIKSANAIRFDTGGNDQRMMIDTTGNVSIGGTPSSAGSGSRWLSLDTPSSNSYSSGILYKINGATKGHHYVENDFMLHQTTSGVGQKFYAGTSVAMTIASNGVATFAGDVTVNGDVQMASGRGISFTASGNASGMTSELLDDYEEGTWTPAFSAYSGTQPTLSQTGSGTYTKIGRQVTVHGTIAVNSISGVVSGLLKIQNLPFGVVTTNTSSGSFASNGLNFARTGHQGLTCIQNTSIGFLTQNMASSWGWEALSILSAGDEIRITFVYETA